MCRFHWLLPAAVQVRIVEFGSADTFQAQLEAMASTDLFVSAHTSNLANALLLTPGAAVVEVLMRNWAWEGEACILLQAFVNPLQVGTTVVLLFCMSACTDSRRRPSAAQPSMPCIPKAATFGLLPCEPCPAGIDRFFQSLTAQLGDVRHYAVRCQAPNETLFLNPTLERLFAHLPPEECYTQARPPCMPALVPAGLACPRARLSPAPEPMCLRRSALRHSP